MDREPLPVRFGDLHHRRQRCLRTCGVGDGGAPAKIGRQIGLPRSRRRSRRWRRRSVYSME